MSTVQTQVHIHQCKSLERIWNTNCRGHSGLIRLSNSTSFHSKLCRLPQFFNTKKVHLVNSTQCQELEQFKTNSTMTKYYYNSSSYIGWLSKPKNNSISVHLKFKNNSGSSNLVHHKQKIHEKMQLQTITSFIES